MGYAIGVDVGGTFTDFILADGAREIRTHKILSTPDDPSRAVLDGFAALAALEDRSLDGFMGAVERIIHGTTVTTNAVLTGNTASTGLVTTRGFRDALEMRRGIREVLYDNKYLPPKPLVPRPLRRPVRERTDAEGRELAPIDLADVDAAADIFAAAGVEAVAVSFLHAYADDAHERRAARRLRERLPDVYVSVSSEILPQVRFYERTSTTVLNACVGPAVAALSRPPGEAAGRRRVRGRAVDHAIERRRRGAGDRVAARRLDPPFGTGGGTDRGARSRPAPRRARLRHHRHGRHQLRGLADARRRAGGDHQRDRRTPCHGAAVDGHQDHRRRRRLDRRDRHRRTVAHGSR